MAGHLFVKQLGLQPYEPIWRAMREYTDRRDDASQDQLWLLEHTPVFTLGQAGRREHLLDPGDIPVLRCDRGGQVTYHGPGQLIVYPLLDLRRARLGVKALVGELERTVIRLLSRHRIDAVTRAGAPGVYVEDMKIASLGLRVRRGCSFHGLSLNVKMDLQPFERINPCGYPGLAVTQLDAFGTTTDIPRLGREFARYLAQGLGYTCIFEQSTEGSGGEHGSSPI